MANAKHVKGGKIKRNRPKCETYRLQGRRLKNKAKRKARDDERAKPMRCGCGSRWAMKHGHGCRRCDL
jgi:hypothetical protein